jgi:BirA family biotin operon repressor/biotin-[acetyl-CoA-carboxylase] ligase
VADPEQTADPLDRPPLDVDVVRAALRPPWIEVRVVAETTSTNADLLAAADRTESGTVLSAEHQSSGRGRLDRSWLAPARSSLLVSALLRPTASRGNWGWLPLTTGVALCDTINEVAGVPAVLKWPNDVLIGSDGRKVAGILTQTSGSAVVFGIGVNVTTTEAELGLPTAISLAMAGATSTDRARLLAGLLTRWATLWDAFEAAGGDAEASGVAAAYRDRCETVGRAVEVTGTDDSVRRGTAVGIDSDGRLRVADESDGVEFVVGAGDVHHVRPA